MATNETPQAGPNSGPSQSPASASNTSPPDSSSEKSSSKQADSKSMFGKALDALKELATLTIEAAKALLELSKAGRTVKESMADASKSLEEFYGAPDKTPTPTGSDTGSSGDSSGSSGSPAAGDSSSSSSSMSKSPDSSAASSASSDDTDASAPEPARFAEPVSTESSPAATTASAPATSSSSASSAPTGMGGAPSPAPSAAPEITAGSSRGRSSKPAASSTSDRPAPGASEKGDGALDKTLEKAKKGIEDLKKAGVSEKGGKNPQEMGKTPSEMESGAPTRGAARKPRTKNQAPSPAQNPTANASQGKGMQDGVRKAGGDISKATDAMNKTLDKLGSLKNGSGDASPGLGSGSGKGQGSATDKTEAVKDFTSSAPSIPMGSAKKGSSSPSKAPSVAGQPLGDQMGNGLSMPDSIKSLINGESPGSLIDKLPLNAPAAGLGMPPEFSSLLSGGGMPGMGGPGGFPGLGGMPMPGSDMTTGGITSFDAPQAPWMNSPGLQNQNFGPQTPGGGGLQQTSLGGPQSDLGGPGGPESPTNNSGGGGQNSEVQDVVKKVKATGGTAEGMALLMKDLLEFLEIMQGDNESRMKSFSTDLDRLKEAVNKNRPT